MKHYIIMKSYCLWHILMINYDALLIAKPTVAYEGTSEEGDKTKEKGESKLGVTQERPLERCRTF